MKNRFMPFGLKHEIAKRWPIHDWHKSKKVAQLINPTIADTAIADLIYQAKPALIGRLGGTEARFLGEFRKISSIPYLSGLMFKVKPNWIKRSKEINTNAGFYFQNIDDAAAFSSLYIEALADTDILGAWGTAFSSIESYFINKVKLLVPVGMTAPWVYPYMDNTNLPPWAKALEGKKILVISPFTKSIETQFARIKHVFGENSCHNFQLLTLKAPMTLNTKPPVDKSWFELLNEIKDLMNIADFDVALVSAGAYSFPLAHHAKKIGKIGIHSGGGLQLFFGIMGKRWEKSEELIKILNQNWVRPTKEETPESAALVEGGCYW